MREPAVNHNIRKFCRMTRHLHSGFCLSSFCLSGFCLSKGGRGRLGKGGRGRLGKGGRGRLHLLLGMGLLIPFVTPQAMAQTADILRPSLVEAEARGAVLDQRPAGDPVLLPPESLIPPAAAVDLPLRRKPKGDPYAAPGLNIGSFRLYPELAVGGTYSSNARQSSVNKTQSAGLRLKPGLRIVSDWVRHSWEGEVSGDITKYFKGSIATPRQFAALSRGRLDIRHTTYAEFESRYEMDKYGPDNTDTPTNAREDLTTHRGHFSAALVHDAGPVQLRLKGYVTRETYSDVKLNGGGKEHNKYRNFVAPGASLRLTYTEPPVFDPFVEAEFSPRYHDKKRNSDGKSLDAHDTTLKLGTIILDDPIWEGEAALVYAYRQFKDHSFKSENSIGVDARLRWAPTELTSLQLTLASGLLDSADTASDSGKTHRARLEITHLLRDNITALAGGSVVLDKQQGGGTNKTYGANLGVEWRINPYVAWSANYEGTWFNRARSSDDYNEQRITAGVVFRR